MSIKIFLIALTATLLLTSCWEDIAPTENLDTSGTTPYIGSGFMMNVPSNWIVVSPENIPTPQRGSVALAMTSTELQNGFANDIVIIKETLTERVTSLKYSIINHALSSREYTAYTDIDSQRIVYSDSEEGNTYTFEAQYSPKTPKHKFVQGAKVCGDTVYLMTFGLGIDTENTEKYSDLIATFACQ